MHARQTSKKVKAAMHTRFANGAHYGAYAPLGYVKDPDKKGHLLIDPETRWIVEKIFDLAVHGRGAASITRILVEEKIPTPGWLNYERYGTFANIYAGAPAEKAYAWTIAQVKSILKEETYIAYVTMNRVDMVKLYPEGNAEARFFLRGSGQLFWYCNRHGLFSRTVQRKGRKNG